MGKVTDTSSYFDSGVISFIHSQMYKTKHLSMESAFIHTNERMGHFKIVIEFEHSAVTATA